MSTLKVNTIQEADGTAFPFGKIINYGQTFRGDSFSESVGANSVSSDCIALNFAASSSSNKLLILSHLTIFSYEVGWIYSTLYIDGSVSAARGDVNDQRSRVTVSGYNANTGYNFTLAHSYLHSNPSTSSVTYSHRLSHSAPVSKECGLNRTYNGANNYRTGQGSSSIVILELAA